MNTMYKSQEEAIRGAALNIVHNRNKRLYFAKWILSTVTVEVLTWLDGTNTLTQVLGSTALFGISLAAVFSYYYFKARKPCYDWAVEYLDASKTDDSDAH